MQKNRNISYVSRLAPRMTSPTPTRLLYKEHNRSLFQKISCQLISYQNIYRSTIAAFISIKGSIQIQGSVTLRLRNGSSPASVLFTAAQDLEIDVFQSTVFIDKHILTFLPDKQKVTIRRSTAISAVKQHNVPANAIFTNENTQNVDVKTHFE